MLPDLVVFGGNLHALAPHDVRHAGVVGTWLAGEPVFGEWS